MQKLQWSTCSRRYAEPLGRCTCLEMSAVIISESLLFAMYCTILMFYHSDISIISFILLEWDKPQYFPGSIFFITLCFNHWKPFYFLICYIPLTFSRLENDFHVRTCTQPCVLTLKTMTTAVAAFLPARPLLSGGAMAFGHTPCCRSRGPNALLMVVFFYFLLPLQQDYIPGINLALAHIISTAFLCAEQRDFCLVV